MLAFEHSVLLNVPTPEIYQAEPTSPPRFTLQSSLRRSALTFRPSSASVKTCGREELTELTAASSARNSSYKVVITVRIYIW